MAEHKGHEAPMKKDGDPPPVSTNVCSSFTAHLGAQVTFTDAASGCKIEKCQSSDVWPFVKADGSDYGPPISFPLLGNQYIYIKSTLAVGQSYPFCTSSECACPVATMKTVTIGG